MTVGRLRRRDLFGALAAPAFVKSAQAAPDTGPYPSREIRLIVPYGAGAGTDAVSRVVARHLADRLGRPVVVENRVGANGNIGTGAVARAAPDGYTLGTATPGPVAVARSLYPALPYEPLRDLEPIVQFNASPVVLLVNPAQPFRTASDLIARARDAPGTVDAAIAANGSINHLVTELFCAETGARLKNIPYAGGAQAMTDTVAGHVDLVFISLSSVVGIVQSGELRALAIAAPERHPRLPGVPTTAEIGYPAVLGSQWNGLVGPAGLPRPIVDRLNTAVREGLATPDIARYLDEQGMSAAAGPPEAFRAFLEAETARWAAIVRQAGIKVE